MNWEQLRKLEYTRVRIRPVAKRFTDETGTQELRRIDGDWLIGRIYDKTVPLRHAGYVLELKGDHIHGWTSDPMRGERFGFLELTCQVHIGGCNVWIEPGVKPARTSH
jgi:hypothetical protein